MKEKVFNELKKCYFEKKKENDEYKIGLEALKKRRDILKDNILVKQYFEYEKQIKDYEAKVLSDRELLDSTLCYFDETNDYGDTNDVYLYLGSFIYNDDEEAIQIARNDEDKSPDYNMYANIESKKVVVLDYSDCPDFEKANKILVLDTFPDHHLLYDVRNDYFKDAVAEGQEKAMQKILKRTI